MTTQRLLQSAWVSYNHRPILNQGLSTRSPLRGKFRSACAFCRSYIHCNNCEGKSIKALKCESEKPLGMKTWALITSALIASGVRWKDPGDWRTWQKSLIYCVSGDVVYWRRIGQEAISSLPTPKWWPNLATAALAKWFAIAIIANKTNKTQRYTSHCLYSRNHTPSWRFRDSYRDNHLLKLTRRFK